MSVFVLDASYTLTWCFLDRATPNTDATLRRLEAALDTAIVPAIWQIEVANALGKGVIRRKMTVRRHSGYMGRAGTFAHPSERTAP